MSTLELAAPPARRRDPRRRYDLRADVWEATVGRHASRVVDDHLGAAATALGGPVHVVDVGAGTARALDRLQRLDVPVGSYLGIERDPAMIAASSGRTSGRPDAAVLPGSIDRCDHLVAAGPRLVLLTWVLSVIDGPMAALATARRLAGADGLVVVAAATAVRDGTGLLDAWIRHRWSAQPIAPLVLIDGAVRLDVTLRGRAVVATVRGVGAPCHTAGVALPHQRGLTHG